MMLNFSKTGTLRSNPLSLAICFMLASIANQDRVVGQGCGTNNLIGCPVQQHLSMKDDGVATTSQSVAHRIRNTGVKERPKVCLAPAQAVTSRLIAARMS